jgi:multidrug efflux pump subunit AcrA (membrane-fusion protein)
MLAVLIAGVAAVGCGSPPPERAPEAMPVDVTVVRAEMTDLPALFDAGGVLRARNASVLSSRIVAPVIRVDVRAGDRVRRGQTLVVLDGAELAAHAARTEAQVTAAKQSGAVAAAEVAGAEGALTLAKATHARIATLAASRSATPHELDQATAALTAADARLTAARARVTETAAALEAATSAATAARVAAAYTVISAPFDGVVAERRVDPGTTAAPGVPLLLVEEAGPLQLEVRLDAARAAHVRLQQRVRVTLDEAAQRSHDGIVSEIARVDPAAHSFAVKIDVPAESAVRSGAFGRAQFEGPARRVLTVPATAVIRRGQLATVFVVSNGIARLRAIAPGAVHRDRVEVLDGLAPGETVVSAPPAGLADGGRVSAKPPAAGGGL